MPVANCGPVFQLPRIAKPSGTDAGAAIGCLLERIVSLPRIAKPSGTWCQGRGLRSSLHCFNFPGQQSHPELGRFQVFSLTPSTEFQLPRIAKPSGTRHRHGTFMGLFFVSTSPDSKAIRNPLRCSFGWWQITSFQLPRIAKPSGTIPQQVLKVVAGVVSTSPDSKAIRNDRSAER